MVTLSRRGGSGPLRHCQWEYPHCLMYLCGDIESDSLVDYKHDCEAWHKGLHYLSDWVSLLSARHLPSHYLHWDLLDRSCCCCLPLNYTLYEVMSSIYMLHDHLLPLLWFLPAQEMRLSVEASSPQLRHLLFRVCDLCHLAVLTHARPSLASTPWTCPKLYSCSTGSYFAKVLRLRGGHCHSFSCSSVVHHIVWS